MRFGLGRRLQRQQALTTGRIVRMALQILREIFIGLAPDPPLHRPDHHVIAGEALVRSAVAEDGSGNKRDVASDRIAQEAEPAPRQVKTRAEKDHADHHRPEVVVPTDNRRYPGGG